MPIIVLDSSCAMCAYNLRGLDVAAKCPECGEPIEASLDPSLLRFADPRWLRRTAIGFYVLAIPLLFAALCMASMYVLVALGGGTDVFLTISQFIGPLTQLLPALGLILATSWRPDYEHARLHVITRDIARLASIWVVLLLVYSWVSFFVGHVSEVTANIAPVSLNLALFLASTHGCFLAQAPRNRFVRRTLVMSAAMWLVNSAAICTVIAAAADENVLVDWIYYLLPFVSVIALALLGIGGCVLARRLWRCARNHVPLGQIRTQSAAN